MSEKGQNRELRFEIKRELHHASVKSFHPFRLDVKAAISPGITVLFGHSGSGKSTLLRSIAGLLTPDQGSISLNDKTLFDRQQRINIPVSKRRIGMVFQSLALFPHLRADENIAYGLSELDETERSKKVDAVIDAFRIRHIRNHPPDNISGGEQQRVALARTLVTEPHALLLDEPLSALDPGTKAHIMDDLRAWIADWQIPVLYVTHSREEVFAMAQHVIALENGLMVGQGSPFEVLGVARHAAVAEWSALENVFEGTITNSHETQGTMTFRTGQLDLEVPLGRKRPGETIRVGLGAHDIVIATTQPQKLSARNILPGRISEMKLRDAMVTVNVNCHGTRMEAHVTPGAVEALDLRHGQEVWVIFKTHSCFILAR